MKKLFITMTMMTALLFGGPFMNTADAQTKTNKKILIAYYSHSGNTETVAKEIQKQLGGDLFEIQSTHSYPDDYKGTTEQAKKEIAAGFRPTLKSKVKNIGSYDMIFVGSPNWWGTLAPVVSTFIEQHDLSGKTVIPFVTHGGGGEQETLADFAKQCKDCDVKKGFITSGDRTRGMDKWLSDINAMKK